MTLILPNNTQLKDIITLLKASFHNDTYNLTETEIQVLQSYLDSLEERGSVDNYTDINKEDVDCGGVLKNLADIYSRQYHFYFAIVVCLFGTLANICNIVVLTRKQMISAPINRILTALATADVLLMVEYIPYAFYYYVILPKNLDFPYSGAVYMLIHAHVTQVLHTTSICLTLMLAVWRYLALGYPEKTNTLCSHFRCTVGIGFSYVLPIVLCVPTYVTITITTQEITENNTTFVLYHTDLHDMFKTDKTLLKINFWIYAVFIKLLPCCILTIISCWLIRTLFKARKRKQVLKNYDLKKDKKLVKSSKTERRAERTTRMLVAVLVLFLVTEFPQGIFALLIGIKGKDLFLECYQLYGEIMDILALINGAINFILYCFMNRMFRATFGQLFKNRIMAHLTPPASGVHATCV